MKWLLARYKNKKPDIEIGENYLSRWYLIPRNRLFNIYLHRYRGSDDDRALHDHPWVSLSYLISGDLYEYDTGGCKHLKSGAWRFRRSTYAHRLEKASKRSDVWTLFLTGPRIRHWGFHCPKGWVPWEKFTDSTGTRVGRGCEE